MKALWKKAKREPLAFLFLVAVAAWWFSQTQVNGVDVWSFIPPEHHEQVGVALAALLVAYARSKVSPVTAAKEGKGEG